MRRIFTIKEFKSALGQSGFTIVELMIALSVLSVLLLMSTLTLIGIGKLYSKGINQAATQNAARNITNDLASQLQLAGGTPVINPTGQHVVCIGNQRYTYQLNTELTNSPNSHILWHDSMNGTDCSALNLNSPSPNDPETIGGSGSEMLAVNMWLTDFDVARGVGSIYNLRVSVAYGSNDLLCDSGTPGDCSASGISNHLTNHTPGGILCKGGDGNEYCAVSSLSTTITRRLNN